MRDVEIRELVRIRHNLRELARTGAGPEAAPLIAQIRALSSNPATAVFDLEHEAARWRSLFRLE